MVSYLNVLAPARLGPVRLRNRVIKATTFEGMTPGAMVPEELIAYHRKVSAGGVGMTTVAYLAVAPEGRTEDGQIRMRPDALPGLQRLADAIHREGTAAAAQIGHAGAVGKQAPTGHRAIAPPRLVNPLSLKMVHNAATADIAQIRRAHGAAACMAVDSGLDAIEIHFGHNYLLAQNAVLELTVGSSLVNPMYLFKGDAPIKEWGDAMSPFVLVGLKLFGKISLRQYPYGDLFMLNQARLIRSEVRLPLVLLGASPITIRWKPPCVKDSSSWRWRGRFSANAISSAGSPWSPPRRRCAFIAINAWRQYLPARVVSLRHHNPSDRDREAYPRRGEEQGMR
jgi:NADH:flavin oxidoreductase / NADH oxidase family